MKLLDLSPISIRSSDGPALPGISSFTAKGWVHGPEAVRNCRLDPQSTVFDVWENLSLDPVTPAEGMRHRADLAVAQLRALRPDTSAEWCVAVPADWSKQTLQLFLGVAQECGLQVQGLFPRALAVASLAVHEEGQCQVLEWGWKGMNLVDVEALRDDWCLSGLHPNRELGVLGLFRRESRLVAEWMLEKYRVDPLDSGATEQDLFDGWWDWHSGGTVDWVASAGTTEMRVSDEAEQLRALHASHIQTDLKTAHVPRSTQPMLAHILGSTGLISETHHLLPVIEGLNLTSTKGPQWRDHVKNSKHGQDATAFATHMVIDGIAEPLPDGVTARPAATIRLEDGRTGLAVRLRER